MLLKTTTASYLMYRSTKMLCNVKTNFQDHVIKDHKGTETCVPLTKNLMKKLNLV